MDGVGRHNAMSQQIAKGLVQLGDDFEGHRIKGFVPHAASRGLDPTLDVPLINHVKGGLWQGGCSDDGQIDLPEGFHYVLSLYPWGVQYVLPDGCARDEVEMYDSLDQGFEQVEELAAAVVKRLAAGETVLVHCQAGLNRSGLLAARILMLHWDYSADQAISLLREQRSPIVLCNDAFETWLRAL